MCLQRDYDISVTALPLRSFKILDFCYCWQSFVCCGLFQEKLKEREREARKRKEREEIELERVRVKARRKDAVTAYQALLTERIKDPEVCSCPFLFHSFIKVVSTGRSV